MKKYVFSLTTFVEIAIGTAAYIAIGAMPSVYSAKNWNIFPYFRIIILTGALLLIYFIEKKRGNDLKIVLPLFFGAVFVYLIFLYVKGYYPRNTFVNGLLWQLDSFYSVLLITLIVASKIADIAKENRKTPIAFIIFTYIILGIFYAAGEIDSYVNRSNPHIPHTDFVFLAGLGAIFLAECILVYYPYFAAKKNFLKGFSESAKFFRRHFVFTSALVIVADILMVFSFLYGKGLNERFVVAGNNT
ncbi:MAG: hypothetical protein J7L03_04320, partial [Caldisericaceae bacterium]|nr:hypothetical protein [Caldisericaceae bacterium]